MRPHPAPTGGIMVTSNDNTRYTSLKGTRRARGGPKAIGIAMAPKGGRRGAHKLGVALRAPPRKSCNSRERLPVGRSLHRDACRTRPCAPVGTSRRTKSARSRVPHARSAASASRCHADTDRLPARAPVSLSSSRCGGDQIDLKAGVLHVNRVKNGSPSAQPLRGPESARASAAPARISTGAVCIS